MTKKVKLQNEFWAIEVIDKKTEVGFVIKSVNGIRVSLVKDVGGFDVASTMFKTRIVSGSEIAEKYGSVADGKDRWMIKNEEGLYLKYSADKNVGYYFDKEMLGAVAFDDIIHMGKFIECWQPEFKVSKFIPVLMKDDI